MHMMILLSGTFWHQSNSLDSCALPSTLISLLSVFEEQQQTAHVLQVFDMFSYVQFEGDPQDVPPAHPPPGWKDAFSARHRVAGTMVAYAKAGGQACITNSH